MNLNKETQKIVGNQNRPIFNWSTKFVSEFGDSLGAFENFKETWNINDEDYTDFLNYLIKLEINSDTLVYQPLPTVYSKKATKFWAM